MREFVELEAKRNRGWPWPEKSFGMDPMFGAEGWCHACGIPQGPQTGSLTLQRRNLTPVGAWVPYWIYDLICVDAGLAEKLRGRFALDLRPVAWPAIPAGDAWQIVIPTVGQAWYDPDDLRRQTLARHQRTGARCPVCGTWKWLPLASELFLPLHITPPLADVDIAASPEWFGDSLSYFRKILVRRQLAEVIAAASPKDFLIREVT